MCISPLMERLFVENVVTNRNHRIFLFGLLWNFHQLIMMLIPLHQEPIERLRYRLNGPGFESPYTKRFFSSPKRPDLLWAPPSILLTGYRNSFPGIKRPGREVNHSPPSSFAVKNGWNRASVPQLCVHAVERDNFFFPIPFGNKNRVFWFSGNALGL